MPSILLTRSVDDNRESAPFFERRGFTVLSVPMIELRPLPKDQCGMRTMRRLAGGEPVLLTSAFATDLWLDLRETDFREETPEAYYVVGSESARLLRDGDPDIPIRAVVHSAAELTEVNFGGVERLLYPCSTERRQEAVEGLRERGIDVVELPLYSPALPAGSREQLSEALAGAGLPLFIAFFSPSAVRNFFSLVSDIPRNAIFAAIGPTTAGALREHGIGEVILPDHPGAEALAGALAGIGDRAA